MKILYSIQIFLFLSLGFILSACYSPGFATSAIVSNEEVKIGRATCKTIFFIPFGKCTIGEAVKNGDIKQVQTVDQKYFSVIFYTSRTIEVRGL